jgi:hypothetical protein
MPSRRLAETSRSGAVLAAAAVVTAAAALLRSGAAPPPPPPAPEPDDVISCKLEAVPSQPPPPPGIERCDRPVDPFPTGVRPADVAQPSVPAGPDGLAVKVIDHPCGTTPPDTDDLVEVRFAGWNARGEQIVGVTTSKLPLSSVVPGFAEVVTRMSVGDRVRAWIPGGLAYDRSIGRNQPALRGMLTFEIELISIDRR